MSNHNGEFASQQQVREIRRRARQVDSMDFFNLITGPELLERLEALLPEYRERKFPPTVTLAMFLGQVLRADSSCQNAVNEAIVNQLLSGTAAVSANTGGYCLARQRLPAEMIRGLARQTGTLMNERTPQGWRWRGRHVKLTDGTTTLMPDTALNQAKYPQYGRQETGAGFPLARLVSVMSLANGAVLDLAVGRIKARARAGMGCSGSFSGALSPGMYAGRQLLLQLFLDRRVASTRGGRIVRAAWRAAYGFSLWREARRPRPCGHVEQAGGET